MSRLEVDLTKVDLIEGEVIGEIRKVEYQTKTGSKWNNEGTTTVSKEQWLQAPDELARIRLTIAIQGKGNLFHELYFMETAMPMTKRALIAMGVNVGPKGYDPDEAIGNKVGMSVIIEETAGYDPRSLVRRFYKA